MQGTKREDKISMDEIKSFENKEFGKVRSVVIDGNVYFVASDVAKSLGYSNPRDAILRHCKGVVKHDIPTNGGKQNVNVIPKGDVVRLVTHSELPWAEKFESWIFDEVIPSVLTNGGYIAGQDSLSDDELIARAVLVAQKKIAEKDKRIAKLEAETLEMSQTIAEMQPKVNYVDVILKSRSTVCTTQIAQDYGMTANKFNKILRDIGIQRKVGKQWILYRQYLDQGYVQSETVDITRSNGLPDTVMHTKWTQKGRLFLHEKLKKSGYIPLIEQYNI